MQEIWKSITGYDGLYEVSNLGNIKSLDRDIYIYSSKKSYKIRKNGKLLKKDLCPKNNTNRVALYDENGIKTRFLVSRLVALEFIENPNNLPDVLHILNKNNDCVDNLKWATEKQSSHYSFTKKGKNHINEGCYKKIKCIETGQIFDNAKKTGLDNSSILKCCKSKVNTVGGYHWEYVN